MTTAAADESSDCSDEDHGMKLRNDTRINLLKLQEVKANYR